MLHCLDYLHSFGLVPVTTAFFNPSFDLKNVNVLNQTMVSAASFRTDLDSLSLIFFSLFNVLSSPIYVLVVT